MDEQMVSTPPDVFPREDPTGYNIYKDDETGEWYAVRITDQSEVPGRAQNREAAIDLAIADSGTPTGYQVLAAELEESE